MGKFLDSEKPKQAQFKSTSSTFSEGARPPGRYRGHLYHCCVPFTHAEENLFPEIRIPVRAYFHDFDIKWHDASPHGNPSNHLCSSQVCCINFLFPFANKPAALKTVLLPFYHNIDQMLPIENGQYVVHEWVGTRKYLNEGKSPKSQPTRGALFTSLDAAVMFQRTDGKRQLVLIEWKYTEAYSGGIGLLAKGESGRRRFRIFREVFGLLPWTLDQNFVTYDQLFGMLFYQPFYQLMRQQILAHIMEQAGELEADVVTLLHIAPAHNLDFRRVTSEPLKALGDSAMDVWQKLAPPGRFKSVSTEQLFGGLSAEKLSGMETWLEYIYERYAWVNQPLPTV